MAVLSSLEPNKVFQYFEEISQIPRPTFQEKAISDYLVGFAENHHFEYHQDGIYNIIIIKEASEGMEDKEPIILQSHMDMVCEKDSSCQIDMQMNGLDLFVDGDYIGAKGTTLGADDGIGVAMSLAILDDDSIRHPRIEFICTVSEESGMEGATALDVSPVKGKRLINIDSEEEYIFTAGCAGGVRAEITLPVSRYDVVGTKIDIIVEGCTGGHSGTEIHKNRTNATLAVVEMLNGLVHKKFPFSIISFTGGNKDNAIPRQAYCSIVTDNDKINHVVNYLNMSAGDITRRVSMTDPNIKINVTTETVNTFIALDVESTKRVMDFLTSVPNGVEKMNPDIPDLVQTSLNLGIMSLVTDELHTNCLLRSSCEKDLDELLARIQSIAESLGGTMTSTGRYAAWEFNPNSDLRQKMEIIYKDIYGKKPVTDVIHAGLECGIISSKIPGIDCVSVGPTILDIHTPQERLSISSTQRMYKFLVKVVEEI